jgi:hypothetical protein
MPSLRGAPVRQDHPMQHSSKVPLVAARSVVARIALSEPAGHTVIAFSPLLVNLGNGIAHDVRLDLVPISREALAAEGCRVWPGEPFAVDPHQQRGDATLIRLERELAAGLHVQVLGSGDLPATAFALAIPDDRLRDLPDGWLPLFETAGTSIDPDRPGRWECGTPSDLVFGVATYSFRADPAPGTHDHFVALPFDRVYVPSGWTPPPALVDTDGN